MMTVSDTLMTALSHIDDSASHTDDSVVIITLARVLDLASEVARYRLHAVRQQQRAHLP